MAKAFEQVWKSVTGMPDAQLTRYRFVNFVANGNVTQVSTAGGNAVGVAYEPNSPGEPTQIVVSGIAFVEIGATINPGEAVMSDDQGRAVPLTGATDPAINHKLGTMIVGGTAGDIGSILLS